MGKRMGYGLQELDSLGTAALLKDIGYVLLPRPSPMAPEHRLRKKPGRCGTTPSTARGYSSKAPVSHRR